MLILLLFIARHENNKETSGEGDTARSCLKSSYFTRAGDRNLLISDSVSMTQILPVINVQSVSPMSASMPLFTCIQDDLAHKKQPPHLGPQ